MLACECRQHSSLPCFICLSRVVHLVDWCLSLAALAAVSFGKPSVLSLPLSAGNCLSHIPSSLTQLIHLQDLNLSGNCLTSIPEGIGTFTELKKLQLHGNQLRQLPQHGWEQLQHLDEVCVQGNQLTALPDGLAKLGVSQGDCSLRTSTLQCLNLHKRSCCGWKGCINLRVETCRVQVAVYMCRPVLPHTVGLLMGHFRASYSTVSASV
jgi:Leucine-rich repeat (LRR) protein